MNTKLAKALRKVARELATEELSYTETKNQKPEIRKDGEGKFQVVMVDKQGALVLNPNSFRGIYKSLKKKAKAHQLASKRTQ
jgi:hypothetical protein